MPENDFEGLVEAAQELRLAGDEVLADPAELGRLAGTSLDESIALFDALTAVRAEVPLPAGALGRTSSAGDVAEAHALAVEAAGTAVERLVSVLEEDMDALYQVAFAYQAADEESGWGLTELGELATDLLGGAFLAGDGSS